jgi:hypothetical protein
MAALGFVYHGIGRAAIPAPSEDEAPRRPGQWAARFDDGVPDSCPREGIGKPERSG